MKIKKGFTIIEVMLSITIMAMVAMAVFPIIGWLISRGRNFANENRAGFLLQEGIEVSANVFLGNWDKDFVTYPTGEYHPAVSLVDSLNKWVLLPGVQDNLETRFSRKIEIFKVCRNTNTGELVTFPCSSPNIRDEKSRMIKTTVFWSEAGNPRSVSTSLLLTELSQ